MSKFSVIVPVYNMESTLDRCLLSLKNQIFLDYEVIIVNDGSTDNSEEICKNYIKDERFKYFYKENGGLVSAVSYGIKVSSGEYICFLDSDDFLGNNFLLNFNNIILKEQYDIVAMGFYYHKSSGNFEFKLINKEEFGLNIIGSYIYSNNISFSNKIFVARWNKAYKMNLVKTFLQDYENFKGLNTGEDSVFNFLALNKNPKIFSSDIVNEYFYDISRDSMTRKAKDYNYYVNDVSFFNEKIDNIKPKYDNDKLNYLTNNIFFMNGMNYINGYIKNKKNAKKNIRKILNDANFYKALCFVLNENTLNLKSKLKYNLLKFKFVNLYIITYKLYNVFK